MQTHSISTQAPYYCKRLAPLTCWTDEIARGQLYLAWLYVFHHLTDNNSRILTYLVFFSAHTRHFLSAFCRQQLKIDQLWCRVIRFQRERAMDAG
jgi:hypothetical protein